MANRLFLFDVIGLDHYLCGSGSLSEDEDEELDEDDDDEL